VGKRDEPFNNPFVAVGRTLKKELEAEAKKPPPPPPKPKPPPERSAEALFREAVSGIAPIHEDQRGRASAPPPPEADDLPYYDEEAEALAALSDLVDGKTSFDISDSDEFIEGAITGLDRRVLHKLRRGEYAINAHIDLHGMTRDPAREAVDKFIHEARQKGQRCVLIVHGRGHNSKDKIPVLKNLLQSWLERGRIAKSVLAFSTARPHDGGAGAVYVLLRRPPR
jgi:DNA-nicking Smr family endonuclease